MVGLFSRAPAGVGHIVGSGVGSATWVAGCKDAEMARVAAMLRGINVGGRRPVKMTELREVMSPFGEVETYLQSGNVLLSSDLSEHALAGELEALLASSLGLSVTVVLRDGDALAQAIEHNPFLAAGASPSSLHVTFLASQPADADLVVEKASGRDEWEMLGRDVFLCCPDGYGNTKLNNSFFERRLGVRATTRNWNTVLALARMLED